MISNAMIKSRATFQFQFLLNFYRTSEKVIEVKLVILMVKSFEKYRHLFNFHILVTVWLFHDLDSGIVNIKAF